MMQLISWNKEILLWDISLCWQDVGTDSYTVSNVSNLLEFQCGLILNNCSSLTHRKTVEIWHPGERHGFLTSHFFFFTKVGWENLGSKAY